MAGIRKLRQERGTERVTRMRLSSLERKVQELEGETAMNLSEIEDYLMLRALQEHQKGNIDLGRISEELREIRK